MQRLQATAYGLSSRFNLMRSDPEFWQIDGPPEQGGPPTTFAIYPALLITTQCFAKKRDGCSQQHNVLQQELSWYD